MTRTTVEKRAAEHFATDTAKHGLTIAHEDGLYRHFRARQPRTNAYWFDITTWPGTLTITGDMGAFVFSRETDMLAFFRSSQGRINPHYWAQKETTGTPTKEYSEDLFRQTVTEHTADAIRWSDAPRGIGKAVRTEILGSTELYYEASARQVLDDFKFKGFTFDDTWEWSFADYNHQFLWCCHAIVWGIAAYDRAKAEKPTPALAATAEFVAASLST